MQHVGKKIKELREEEGWTRVQLGVYAGVSTATVSQAESGKRTPNAETLVKLAHALGVEPGVLFAEEESPASLGEGPRTLGDVLARAGLTTRWLLLPDEEFNDWWLGVDREEAITRYWQINAEYEAIAAEWRRAIEDASTASPELQKELSRRMPPLMGRHLLAMAAAPGMTEPEEEFYSRQSRREYRRFRVHGREDSLEAVALPGAA